MNLTVKGIHRMIKICNKCKIDKSLDKFYKDKSTQEGLTYYCKKCLKEYRKANKDIAKEYNKKYRKGHKEETKKYNKEYRKANPEYSKEYYEANRNKIKNQIYMRSYGLTLEQALEIKSNGCEVCGAKAASAPKSGKLVVLCIDHCHKSGIVRGCLCNSCNAAYGYLKEDKERIKALGRYHDKYKLSFAKPPYFELS